MKTIIKFFLTLLPAAMLALSCDKYDDSAINTRVDNLEGRVTELEKIVKELNTNIGAVSTTLDALNNQDKIVKVEPLPSGDGFTVQFEKAGTITIYNGTKGKDGIDGKDGVSPVISVKKDTDGIYYWTLNGEWLLEGGAKIPATSKVIVPQMKVENGKFMFSTDGAAWTEIGDAGTAGVGIIKDVKDNGDNVVFTLSDNTMISIPKTQDFALVIENSAIGVNAGETVNVPYTITSADEGTMLKVFADGGYSAQVNSSSLSAGNIAVTAPDPLTDASILVVAVNSKGVMSGKILEFAQGQLVVVTEALTAPADGGEVELKINTNVNYTIQLDPVYNWISRLPDTKALRTDVIRFSIAPNTAETERRGIIRVIGNGEAKEVVVVQAGNVVVAGGGEADFETINYNVSLAFRRDGVTANGWKVNKVHVLGPAQWEGTIKVPMLAGMLTNPGNIVSPVLEGGCGKLTLMYGTHLTSDNYIQGMKFNIVVKDEAGTVKYSEDVFKAQTDIVQKKVETASFDVNLSGKFTITVTNLCPSKSMSNFTDNVSILSIKWTGFAG